MAELEDLLPRDAGTLPLEPSGLEMPGIVKAISMLPPGSIISEHGLAAMFDKCIASIKAAVHRGELPRRMKLMGKNVWTAGSIIRFIDGKIEHETRKFDRLSGR